MITKSVNKAKEALINNQVIGIPTETVYGLAGNAFNEIAVSRIFALKNRPRHNPLIVHIKSAEYLEQIAAQVPEKAYKLAVAFWPGPLTLVLKKKSNVPDIITSGQDTVAVRVPNHKTALELLAHLDFPLAAPSANPFGKISPTSPEHVNAYFKDKLEVILDGGICVKGIESTIIGFEDGQPVLYRYGSLSVEEIEKVVGPLLLHTKNDVSPKAPGMLSKHYAPATPTYFTDDVEKFITQHKGKRIGVLLFKDRPLIQMASHVKILSSNGNLDDAAHNLYQAMHHLDNLNLDVIIAEKLPDQGLGKAINDRLNRAAK